MDTAEPLSCNDKENIKMERKEQTGHICRWM